MSNNGSDFFITAVLLLIIERKTLRIDQNLNDLHDKIVINLRIINDLDTFCAR